MVPKIPRQTIPEIDKPLENPFYDNDVRLERPSLAYEDDYQVVIVWRHVLLFTGLHALATYGFILPKEKISTMIIVWIIAFIVMFGTTIGAHRYYTHRSFKANLKLKLFLVFMQTVALQNSMFDWVRDHRVHHKFTDTNADPHNSKRGFFFSHFGWLMCKRHPDVKKFGAKVDMSDLKADPIVMFQHKYYIPLAIAIGFALPVWITWLFGESFNVAFNFHMYRFIISLHITGLINSVSHLWGYKPFDKNISSTDSLLIGTFCVGEGWHNYHHVFPWDYKAAEQTSYLSNLSLAVIDFFAWIGWATELKTVSAEMIKARAARTGDGSYLKAQSTLNKVANGNNKDHKIVNEQVANLWGWGDEEMTDEDRKYVTILCK